MKRYTILAAVPLICILLWLSSCSKTPADQVSLISAYYRGAAHSFTSANGMYVSQSTNYSNVSGAESTSGDAIAISFTGSNTGTYPLGHTYTNDLSVITSGKTYSSLNAPSHGSIVITSLDANSLIATGTYSGTLFTTSAHDSLPVTQGTISVRYQF